MNRYEVKYNYWASAKVFLEAEAADDEKYCNLYDTYARREKVTVYGTDTKDAARNFIKYLKAHGATYHAIDEYTGYMKRVNGTVIGTINVLEGSNTIYCYNPAQL